MPGTGLRREQAWGASGWSVQPKGPVRWHWSARCTRMDRHAYVTHRPHHNQCSISGGPGILGLALVILLLVSCLSIEFVNVGGWLTSGDLALDSCAQFLAVAEHRLIPSRARSICHQLRRAGFHSVWAPACQDRDCWWSCWGWCCQSRWCSPNHTHHLSLLSSRSFSGWVGY